MTMNQYPLYLRIESATKYYKKYHKDSLVTEISGMQIKTEF
jgi:hypothetical protein